MSDLEMVLQIFFVTVATIFVGVGFTLRLLWLESRRRIPLKKWPHIELFIPTKSRPLPPNKFDRPVYKLSADIGEDTISCHCATYDITAAVEKFRYEFQISPKTFVDIKWIAGKQPIRRVGSDRFSCCNRKVKS